MSRTFKIVNSEINQSGWYKTNHEDNVTLCITNSNKQLAGAIRFNDTIDAPQFEGYDGIQWVPFNATKGDKGDKGDNFSQIVKLSNMEGGEGQLFQHNSIDLSSGNDIINIRTLKSGSIILNEEENPTMEITNEYGCVKLNSLSQPHNWSFVDKNIDQLKSKNDEHSVFKCYGETSTWTTSSKIHKGQAVRIVNKSNKICIEPLIFQGIPNKFRQNISVLGIAIEDADANKTCKVCTRGITTVRCTNDIINHYMGDGDVAQPGLPGLVSNNGFIFNCKVKPSVDYISAGYFIESGPIADNNKYALFYVNP